MEYREFKERMLEKLRDFYGKDAEITVKTAGKDDEENYEGLEIWKEEEEGIFPVFDLGKLYQEYKEGRELDDLAGMVIDRREDRSFLEEMPEIETMLSDWEKVKGMVYPVLSRGGRWKASDLVTDAFLDFAVCYIIRLRQSGDMLWHVKAGKELLKGLGVDPEVLRRQAVENIKKDGYHFTSMEEIINEALGTERMPGEEERIPMYILTNESGAYGAAGLLDQEMVRRFCREENYFILPSSVHETVFVPEMGLPDPEMLDELVKSVNQDRVPEAEQLSDHCYYYNGKTGEIQMKREG